MCRCTKTYRLYVYIQSVVLTTEWLARLHASAREMVVRRSPLTL